MSLRIRRLKILVTAENGLFGTDIQFPDGLVIIRADNTSGKSTIIRAIIYSLGLERTLGSKTIPPLTPAVMSKIKHGNEELNVLESNVFLEIENHENKIITIKRKLAGANEQERKLIQVWQGPSISHPEREYTSRSFFVRDPGAASREDGFHYFLTKFIGWDLPQVARYNGTLTTLYMELIIPLIYIEQSGGWSSIQAMTPRFFQILEPEKRAVEFIMALDCYERETELQTLLKKKTTIKNEWRHRMKECEFLSQAIGGNIIGFPTEPTTQWPSEIEPYIEIVQEDKWVSLNQAIESNSKELKNLEAQEIPKVEQVSDEIMKQLKDVMNKINDKEIFVSELRDSVGQEEAQLSAIDERLKILDEDLKKNQDVKKLLTYGATEDLRIKERICPTCSQSISDVLLQQIDRSSVMTIDDNIAFINSQIKTFKQMQKNVEKSLKAKEYKLNAAYNSLSELQGIIRALKQTLVTDGRAPAESAIRERVVLQEKITSYNRVYEKFIAKLERFADLSKEWTDLQARLKELGKDFLSKEDRKKLAQLATLFLKQEKQYGFDSFPVEKLAISQDNYHPVREGFNLIFDISASDNIRTISAYVISLLELSRNNRFKTNHPGLLLLDEPRQQSLKWTDFKEVIERLASAENFGQQVILATSEDDERLKNIIKEISVHYRPFDGYILQKLEE